MQALSRHLETLHIPPLGERRGASDLSPFALDLSWIRAESDSAARPRAYPSPPMSGSPPLPPKSAQEAGDRGQGQGIYHTTTSQDVYRGLPTTHGDVRQQAGPLPQAFPQALPQVQPSVQPQPHMRPYPPEAPERMHQQQQQHYGFPRLADAAHRPLSYPPQMPAHMMPQHQYLPNPSTSPRQSGHVHSHSHVLPPSMPGPMPGTIPGTGAGATGVQTPYSIHPRPSTYEGQPYTSPKTQRKTKGHVASACVPCKRAHLRCDAQRPCSRCISNGKEESCIDVQHKKRGRPRLRDDRELRYDIPGRGGHSQEAAMRRPISLYSQPPSTINPSYDDSMRGSQSYRVLKSHPAEGVASRFPERGSASDANIYPAPLSIATRPPETAAFLTMDFEMAKASATFLDAISRHSVKGLKLQDVVVPLEQERVLGYQRQLQDEQVRKEPNYLPPIFGKQEEDRVIQTLGFSTEEMSRYSLDRQELLTFAAHDGHPRTYPIRFGLAKKDSIYFVVIQLVIGPRAAHGHLTPSPHTRDPRDIPIQYPPTPQPYAQPTPVSATFDPGRPRLGSEASAYGIRPPGSATSSQQMMPGLSPRLPSYAPSSGSSSRPDYSPGPGSSSPYQVQVPRSELLPPHARSVPQQQAGFQLPPIRSQQPQVSVPPLAESSWPPPRDDRSRVDIGGLIEKQDPRPHQQPQ